MTSKPRHGRDYRYRTPQNSNLIQVPGATTGYVSVVDCLQTTTNTLQISFDGELSPAPGDPIQIAWLGIFDVTSLPGSLSDVLANLNTPASVNIIDNSPFNGLRYIEATYGITIDPTIHAFLINWNEAHPPFIGRLLNQFQIHDIHA